MHSFVDLFAHQFGKVLIPDDQNNSFRASPRVYVEVDLKWKFLAFISVCIIDGVKKQKVCNLNLPNFCFAYQVEDHLIRDCPQHHPRLGQRKCEEVSPSAPGSWRVGTYMASKLGVGSGVSSRVCDGGEDSVNLTLVGLAVSSVVAVSVCQF